MQTYPNPATCLLIQSTPNPWELYPFEYWLVFSLLRLEINANGTTITVQLKPTQERQTVFLRSLTGGFDNPTFSGPTEIDAINALLEHIEKYPSFVQYGRKSRELRGMPKSVTKLV